MSPRTGTPSFAAGPVTVRAPATSANLGPGFDSFGLALMRYDSVTATVVGDGDGLTVDVTGEGAGQLPLDEEHLIVRAFRATVDALGLVQPGLRLSCDNTIPQACGLGSSAAAIVSGIRLAEALATAAALRPGQDLELATTLEGHPDNVAACLRGGFTIAWTDLAWTANPSAAGVHAVRLDVDPDVQPVVLVPPSGVSTSAARVLLPSSVTHGDASATAARAGLLTAALTAYPELLFAATGDRLHQEHRRAAMPQTLDLVDRLRDRGIPAVVSGAGPSVLVLATSARPFEPARWCPHGWTVLSLPVDTLGAVRQEASPHRPDRPGAVHSQGPEHTTE